MPDRLDPTRAAPAGANDDKKARRQLVVRGATAAGLIVALLAVLAITEHQSGEEPAPTVHMATPPAVQIAGTQSDGQSGAVADTGKDLVAKSADAPTLSQASEVQSAPIAEAASEPVAVVPEETSVPATVLGVPATMEAPAPKSTKAVPEKAASTPRLMVGGTAHTEPPPKPAVAPKPVVAQKTETAPALKPEPAAKPEVPSAIKDGFVVQLGVFSNYTNAQELHDKLTQAGVNAHLETRVQLGPFKTRKEALDAQAKLKRLGIASGMVVPTKR